MLRLHVCYNDGKKLKKKKKGKQSIVEVTCSPARKKKPYIKINENTLGILKKVTERDCSLIVLYETAF